jgi:hypothetical protein
MLYDDPYTVGAPQADITLYDWMKNRPWMNPAKINPQMERRLEDSHKNNRHHRPHYP